MDLFPAKLAEGVFCIFQPCGLGYHLRLDRRWSNTNVDVIVVNEIEQNEGPVI